MWTPLCRIQGCGLAPLAHIPKLLPQTPLELEARPCLWEMPKSRFCIVTILCLFWRTFKVPAPHLNLLLLLFPPWPHPLLSLSLIHSYMLYIVLERMQDRLDGHLPDWLRATSHCSEDCLAQAVPINYMSPGRLPRPAVTLAGCSLN